MGAIRTSVVGAVVGTAAAAGLYAGIAGPGLSPTSAATPLAAAVPPAPTVVVTTTPRPEPEPEPSTAEPVAGETSREAAGPVVTAAARRRTGIAARPSARRPSARATSSGSGRRSASPDDGQEPSAEHEDTEHEDTEHDDTEQDDD
ncbi:MAG: hypothetical protein ACKVZ6_04190 [Kineosporiaceae bacterium]